MAATPSDEVDRSQEEKERSIREKLFNDIKRWREEDKEHYFERNSKKQRVFKDDDEAVHEFLADAQQKLKAFDQKNKYKEKSLYKALHKIYYKKYKGNKDHAKLGKHYHRLAKILRKIENTQDIELNSKQRDKIREARDLVDERNLLKIEIGELKGDKKVYKKYLADDDDDDEDDNPIIATETAEELGDEDVEDAVYGDLEDRPDDSEAVKEAKAKARNKKTKKMTDEEKELKEAEADLNRPKTFEGRIYIPGEAAAEVDKDEYELHPKTAAGTDLTYGGFISDALATFLYDNLYMNVIDGKIVKQPKKEFMHVLKNSPVLSSEINYLLRKIKEHLEQTKTNGVKIHNISAKHPLSLSDPPEVRVYKKCANYYYTQVKNGTFAGPVSDDITEDEPLQLERNLARSTPSSNRLWTFEGLVSPDIGKAIKQFIADPNDEIHETRSIEEKLALHRIAEYLRQELERNPDKYENLQHEWADELYDYWVKHFHNEGSLNSISPLKLYRTYPEFFKSMESVFPIDYGGDGREQIMNEVKESKDESKDEADSDDGDAFDF